MVGVDETQPMQQSQEVEQPQGRVQEREQAPEAEQAGQRAGAGQASSQALQEQIAQAVRPVLAEFHQHLAQAVRQEVDPVRKELQQEAQQARQPSRHEEQRAQLGPAQGQQRQEERRHTLDALQPRLRQLKLSGMHDAIVSRADEARSQGLDPVEFLALLLDDELARREAEGLARRIRQARFDEVCDLRDFDFSYNPEIPEARLWELASGHFIEEHASVLLCGPTGVGKTFVAQALGLEACRQQRSVLFAKTAAVLADLAGGRADGSHPTRLRRYLSPALLILDDFAMREYTVRQTEDIYELVDRRYRRGSLVVTTNRLPADLYPLFPNPVLAEGLLDRLLNSAYIVTMLGRSYRPRQRPAAAWGPPE